MLVKRWLKLTLTCVSTAQACPQAQRLLTLPQSSYIFFTTLTCDLPALASGPGPRQCQSLQSNSLTHPTQDKPHLAVCGMSRSISGISRKYLSAALPRCGAQDQYLRMPAPRDYKRLSTSSYQSACMLWH